MKNITTKQAQAMTKKEINNLIQTYNKLNKQRKMLFGSKCSDKPRGHKNVSIDEIKFIDVQVRMWIEVFNEHGITTK